MFDTDRIATDPTHLGPSFGQSEPGLPLDAELTDAEQAEIEAAVDDANALVNRAGMELATGMHDLVVGRFFGGDYDAFAGRNRYKPRTFTAFAAHARLQLALNTVYQLVRVAEHARHLRSEVAWGLSVTHHKVLLGLPAPADRAELAEQAHAQGWTVVQLTEAVRERQGPEPAGDERRVPPITADSVRAMLQELDRLTPARLARDLKRMSAAEQRRTARRLDTAEARIKALRALLPEA